MKENIICSGALFYCTVTKRFLFVQRTDAKTRGLWGLVGGQARFTESAFEGLKREIQEEVGDTPKFKKVIFVHGCFWHRHPACKLAYSPKSRIEFWNKNQ